MSEAAKKYLDAIRSAPTFYDEERIIDQAADERYQPLVEAVESLDSENIDHAIEQHIPYPEKVRYRLAWYAVSEALRKVNQ